MHGLSCLHRWSHSNWFSPQYHWKLMFSNVHCAYINLLAIPGKYMHTICVWKILFNNRNKKLLIRRNVYIQVTMIEFYLRLSKSWLACTVCEFQLGMKHCIRNAIDSKLMCGVNVFWLLKVTLDTLCTMGYKNRNNRVYWMSDVCLKYDKRCELQCVNAFPSPILIKANSFLPSNYVIWYMYRTAWRYWYESHSCI